MLLPLFKRNCRRYSWSYREREIKRDIGERGRDTEKGWERERDSEEEVGTELEKDLAKGNWKI